MAEDTSQNIVQQRSQRLWDNLYTAIKQRDIHRDQTISRQSSSLENLIKTTNDYDAYINLEPRIKEYDETWDNQGYDETGDILLNIYSSKKDIMLKGQQAFDTLNEMNLNIVSEGGFDKISGDVMDMDWGQVNKNMQEMFVLQSQLEQASTLGIKFKGSDKIAPASLKVVTSQYQSIYNNKFNLLAQANIYDIPDEDIQAFDEEFKMALMTYQPADFAKFMGRHQGLIQGKFEDAERLVNTYYNAWKTAEASGSAEAVEGLPEYSQGDILSAEVAKTRYDEYLTQAQRLNERHNQFYGAYYDENSRFIEGFKEPGAFDLESEVDKLKVDEKDDDSEIVKEDEPTKAITEDLQTGLLSVEEGQTKGTLIQSGMWKIHKKGDISSSVKQVDYYNKEDGMKVDVTSYDKNKNTYRDIDGKEYKSSDLSLSSDSLKDYRPKLKKANGDFYFFNPVKNQFTKWAKKGQGFDNQYFESSGLSKGRKVPVIYLKSTLEESLRYYAVGKEKGEKLLYLDGKWKHFKLDKGIWKLIK